MDPSGVFLLMSYLVLFILSFAQVTVGDWNSAIFIAPLVSLFRVFFVFFLFGYFLTGLEVCYSTVLTVERSNGLYK